MSGYFASIADRLDGSRAAEARPDSPAPAGRDVLEDPFATIVDDSPVWQSSTTVTEPAVPDAPAPQSQAGTMEPGPLQATAEPEPVSLERTPPEASAEPASEQPAATPSVEAGEIHDRSGDDVRRVDEALRAMDEVLFAAAGIEPPTDLPAPGLLPTQMTPEAPGETLGSEVAGPEDANVREVSQAAVEALPTDAEPPPSPPREVPGDPVPIHMTPEADVVEIEPPPASVNIGRITVEVREPAPTTDRVLGPADAPAPRPVSFPRAQRLLSPQQRRLG
jgi:hypothetical protein